MRLEVQDEKTCRTGYYYYCCYYCCYVELYYICESVFSSIIVYSAACYCITIDLLSVARAGGLCLCLYNYLLMVDLASIHKCSLPENGELKKKHSQSLHWDQACHSHAHLIKWCGYDVSVQSFKDGGIA